MKIARDPWRFRFQKSLKRACDVLFSGIGLVLLSPVLAAIGVMVRIESPGPVIYRHRRIGRDGVPFDLYKFRSMAAGGDDAGYLHYLQELIESERSGNAKPLPYRKMKGDDRITRVGAFLRRYYLDELPQLWNILRGDMSLVGPRPHVQFEVNYYTPEQRRRLSVRPGVTGYWQVRGKADSTFNELIAMDLAYIDDWSLWRDFQFVFETLRIMLRGGEAFWARMTKRVPGTGAAGGQGPGSPSAEPLEEDVITAD